MRKSLIVDLLGTISDSPNEIRTHKGVFFAPILFQKTMCVAHLIVFPEELH